MKNLNTIKVCKVITAPISLYGLSHSLKRYKDLGVDLTILCSKDEHYEKLKNDEYYQLIPINIKREISILSDLVSLTKLYFFFKKNKFDIIHSNTPKAGLLTSLSGWLVGHPLVFHTFTGQRWLTLNGLKRKLLIACDKVIVSLNKHCFADGTSQIRLFEEMNISKVNEVSCIGFGSHAGVDLNKFNINGSNCTEARRSLGFDADDIIISFLGRVVNDKGINELVGAFRILKDQTSHNIKLLIIGPYEESLDPIDSDTSTTILEDEDIISLGMVDFPENYLCTSDIFAIPSYREGFPTVVLEANALGIPAVGTDVIGVKDTIVNNETGLLCKLKDMNDLAEKLLSLIKNDELRKELGKKAYERSKNLFSSEMVTENIINEYKKWLKQ